MECRLLANYLTLVVQSRESVKWSNGAPKTQPPPERVPQEKTNLSASCCLVCGLHAVDVSDVIKLLAWHVLVECCMWKYFSIGYITKWHVFPAEFTVGAVKGVFFLPVRRYQFYFALYKCFHATIQGYPCYTPALVMLYCMPSGSN